MKGKIALAVFVLLIGFSCKADEKLAGIIATIGETPISTLDISSNAKLLILFGELSPAINQEDANKQSLENILTERAIIEHAIKNNIKISDLELQSTLLTIASGFGQATVSDLYKYIEGEGISKDMMKNKIKAHLTLKKIIDTHPEQKIGQKEIKNFIKSTQQAAIQNAFESTYKIRYLELVNANNAEEKIKNFETLSALSKDIKNCKDITMARNYNLPIKLITETLEIKEDDLNTVFKDAIMKIKDGQLATVFSNNKKMGLIAICEKKKTPSNKVVKNISEDEALAILIRQKRSELVQNIIQKIKNSSSVQIEYRDLE